ncbi:immunoglobulin-like domain-containing protein [Parablautia muri]|uniref:Bacterial Ig-like domain-containing protein n=1 Tax=Parablautia muri TaxID=2320879 RepID=A0A9X5BHN3_9FIRM|nr:immunoglobulin-like domain-containing protein [Parablautia muri]NBJ93067.1 hypothetical protein [Parablautia muri]
MKRCKKAAAMLIGAVLLVSLVGCGAKLGEEFTEEVNTLEGATLTVDEESVSSEGITYTVDNQSETDLNFGQDYSLQKEEKGKWYQLSPANPVAVTMELLWVPAGSSETLEINWDAAYGKLPAGHYRILKNFADNENGYYLAGEFTLE